MKIDLEVLDDVLRELSRGGSFASRPIIEKVRSLKTDELRSLAWLSRTSGRATFEQLWFIEYVLYGDERFSKAELERMAEEFAEQGVISIVDDRITFVGDEFDRIYLKYYARTRGEHLVVTMWPVRAAFRIGLTEKVNVAFEPNGNWLGLYMISEVEGVDIRHLLREIVSQFVSGNIQSRFAKKWRPLIDSFYQQMFIANLRDQESVQVVVLSVSNPWLKEGYMFPVAENVVLSRLLDDFDKMISRAAESDAVVKVDTYELDAIGREKLIRGVKMISDEIGILTLEAWHLMKFASAYYDEHDVVSALCHIEARLEIEDESSNLLNNAGYVYMANGNYIRSYECLNRAVELAHELPTAALPLYNLGCVELMRGNFGVAVGCFSRAVLLGERLGLDEHQMSCLFVPEMGNGAITLVEVERPNLLECARDALEFVRSIHQEG